MTLLNCSTAWVLASNVVDAWVRGPVDQTKL